MKGVDDSAYYNIFNIHGIPALVKPIDLATLAKYKYHMDIGGGGGDNKPPSVEFAGKWLSFKGSYYLISCINYTLRIAHVHVCCCDDIES